MPINAAAVAPSQRRLHTTVASMTQPAAAAAASARAFDGVEATTNVAATRATQESNDFRVQRWLSETTRGEAETIQTAHHSFLQRHADSQLTEAALGDEGVHSSMRKMQVKSIGKARQPFVNDGGRARE